MSGTYVLGLTILRCLALAIVGWGLVRPLVPVCTQRASRLLGMLLAASWLVPPLLVGYAWNFAVLWPDAARELLLGTLLLARVVPLGVLAAQLWPAAGQAATGLHIAALVAPRLAQRLAWRWECERALPPVALMFLAAFQEFELPALLRLPAWTDWMFVRQVGGQTFDETLRQALPGILVAALPLALLLRTPRSAQRPAVMPHTSATYAALATGVLVVLVLLAAVFPMVAVGLDAAAGLQQLAVSPTRLQLLLREMGASLLFAIAATSLAVIVQPYRWAAGFAICGAAGALLVGLAVQACFLRGPLASTLYDTPAPLVLGLALWLLPRASLLAWWQQHVRPAESLKVARLLPSHALLQQLVWQQADRPRLLGYGLLVMMAYWEVILPGLLAPTRLPSGVVRLYNFMHYGRAATLSAEAIVYNAAPLLVAGSLLWLKRPKTTSH